MTICLDLENSECIPVCYNPEYQSHMRYWLPEGLSYWLLKKKKTNDFSTSFCLVEVLSVFSLSYNNSCPKGSHCFKMLVRPADSCNTTLLLMNHLPLLDISNWLLQNVLVWMTSLFAGSSQPKMLHKEEEMIWNVYESAPSVSPHG